MRSLFKTLIVRLTLVMGVCLIIPSGDSPMPAAQPDQVGLSIYKPAGKIRKLHLVRPDLIPYPLANEIYC